MSDQITLITRKTMRRRFLQTATAGSKLLAMGWVLGESANRRLLAAEEPEEEISPAEDLMREHGVLKRILLVYQEAIRRLDGSEEIPQAAIRDSAGIIRSFIEDYHEKLEEDFIFPRFRKAGNMTSSEMTASSGSSGRWPRLRRSWAFMT